MSEFGQRYLFGPTYQGICFENCLSHFIDHGVHCKQGSSFITVKFIRCLRHLYGPGTAVSLFCWSGYERVD